VLASSIPFAREGVGLEAANLTDKSFGDVLEFDIINPRITLHGCRFRILILIMMTGPGAYVRPDDVSVHMTSYSYI
jgi:hypothetical protein